jgi:hypothetical protein
MIVPSSRSATADLLGLDPLTQLGWVIAIREGLSISALDSPVAGGWVF